MAGSEYNAKDAELLQLIAQEYPGHFLKSNKPYSKGAMLIDKTSGQVVESAETNYGLLDKLTRPGYQLPEQEGFFTNAEVSSFDHVYRSEMKKMEEIINDCYKTAEEWSNGREIKLMFDFPTNRFHFIDTRDAQPILKRGK